MEELRRIENDVNELRQKPEFIISSIRETRRRATLCIQRQGQHVEGV